jgi:hypothetical protein
VAHHPIGIPAGAEMSSIQPFLSKRLAEQLQTAKACEEDYLRQARQTTDARKPGWLKSGLFSGNGNRATPVSAWPVRKGPQEDGSYLVDVNLFGQAIDLGNGLKGGAGGTGWQVAIKVISENGRYVIDDVRMPDGDSTDGPSHVLSDSFKGCDGPRWISLTAANR